MSGKRVGVLVLVLAVVLGCGVFGSVQADEVKSGKSEAELDAEIAQQMSFIEKGLKTLESGGEHYYYTVADMEAMSLERAQAGDHVEQFNLGICYYYHREENPEYIDKALYWLEKGAEGGNTESLLLLGQIYHEGILVEADYAKARKCYTQAMEQGSKLAQSHLGVMDYYGLGADADYDKALELLQPLVDEGLFEPQVTIGIMYFLGHGVEINFLKAIELWKNNVEKAEPHIKLYYGCIYFNGGYGIEQNYDIAFKWIKNAADENCIGAQSLLGLMYFQGLGVEKNYHLARMSLEKGMSQGELSCSFILGVMYKEGIEYKKNIDKAKEMFHIAAEHNMREIANIQLKELDDEEMSGELIDNASKN